MAHLHHQLVQALLACVIGLLLDGLQLALVLADQALHLRLQALHQHPHPVTPVTHTRMITIIGELQATML